MDVELFTTNASYVKDGSIGASFGRGTFAFTVVEDARTKKEQTKAAPLQTEKVAEATPSAAKSVTTAGGASVKTAPVEAEGGATSVKSGQPVQSS